MKWNQDLLSTFTQKVLSERPKVTDNYKLLESIRINETAWNFVDLRLNIPPMSLGSDASNPHTQYSNAIASFNDLGITGIGACFTLGEGNQYVCAAAEYIIRQLDGFTLKELLDSKGGLADILGNPVQLRWLSPNAGLPLMAAGLIVNTLIDFASKKANLPAWKFLAYLDIDELIKFISLRHIKESSTVIEHFQQNTFSGHKLNERIEELENLGLPAYFTTWIGSDAGTLIHEMNVANVEKGISNFKIKIGSDISSEIEKIDKVMTNLPSYFSYSADANQKLDFESARDWMKLLSSRGFQWLEEPFAPDNVLLFRDLATERNKFNWNCEIATGENCPNLHTAQALLQAGINRFQADPCRMMGIFDGAFAGILSKFYDVEYTPHAGGAGLDELSRHLQYFFLAKVDTKKKIEDSLTETIGFCSRFYSHPSKVEGGRILSPEAPGLLVGLAPEVFDCLIPFTEGVTWLEL